MPTGESIIQGLGSHTIPVVVLAVVLAVAVGALLYRYRLMRLGIFLGGFAVGAAAASFLCGGAVSLLIGLVAGIGCQFVLPFGAKQEVPKLEENKRPEQLTQPVANAVVSRAWKTGAELEAFIADRKLLHSDMLYLMRSIAGAIWVNNVVAKSGRKFEAELGRISESDDRKLATLRVRQGLDSVNLGDFDNIVTRMSEIVSRMMQTVSGQEDYYDKYPQLQRTQSIPKATESSDGSMDCELRSSLNSLRRDYAVIVQHYEQLYDGFSRFDKLIVGGGGWKSFLVGGAIGGALGYYLGDAGAELGAVAIEKWENWKGKGDKDFCEDYVHAVQDFIASCERFMVQGERIITARVMDWQERWNSAFAEEELILRKLNEDGVDLGVHEDRICQRLWHDLSRSLNGEAVLAVALALEIMKDDNAISSPRIERFIRMLRKVGCPIEADGSLTDVSENRNDISSDEIVQRLDAIAAPCVKCGSFYIAEEKLQKKLKKKLINALREYGRGVSIDDVWGFYDDTFFGSADEGFVVAKNGICWNVPGKKANFCAWKDMTMIRAPKDDGNIVRINQIDVKVPDRAAAKFANLLSALKTLFVQSNV